MEHKDLCAVHIYGVVLLWSEKEAVTGRKERKKIVGGEKQKIVYLDNYRFCLYGILKR
jgi:hypothetical protein